MVSHWWATGQVSDGVKEVKNLASEVKTRSHFFQIQILFLSHCLLEKHIISLSIVAFTLKTAWAWGAKEGSWFKFHGTANKINVNGKWVAHSNAQKMAPSWWWVRCYGWPAPGFVKCESHSHCTTDSDHMARLTPFLAHVSHYHHCMLHLRKNSG